MLPVSFGLDFSDSSQSPLEENLDRRGFESQLWTEDQRQSLPKQEPSSPLATSPPRGFACGNQQDLILLSLLSYLDVGSEPIDDISNSICPRILWVLLFYLFDFKSLKSMSRTYIQVSHWSLYCVPKRKYLCQESKINSNKTVDFWRMVIFSWLLIY